MAATAAGLVALAWVSAALDRPHSGSQRIVTVAAAQQPYLRSSRPPTRIRVVTWKLAAAHTDLGTDSVTTRITHIAQLLRAFRADALLLQSVDFDSARSAGVDHLQELAAQADYPFAAYAPAWRSGYAFVPSCWPLPHLGRVLAGGGVLSRYPIVANHVTLLPSHSDSSINSATSHHYAQFVTIQAGAMPLTLVNLDLAPTDKDARAAQARTAAAAIRRAAAKTPVIAGGSLQALPPDALIYSGFTDAPELDYSNDPTLDLLFAAGLSDPAWATPVVPEALWTYPGQAPSRRLNYVLATTELTPLGIYTTKIGTAADYLPVIADWMLPAH